MIFRYFEISQEKCRKVVGVQGQHTEVRIFPITKSDFRKKMGISFSPEMFHNKTIFEKKEKVNGHGAIVSSSPAGLSCSRNRTNGRNGFGVLNDIG